MKRLIKSVAACSLALFCVQPGSTFGQAASPGPYEILPFADAYIVEAFCDLLPSTGQIADWTGWTSGTWISPNAYNNHGGTDFSVASGTPVYAAVSGTVVDLVTNIPANNHDLNYYGNYVKIRANGLSPDGQQITVLTAHMMPGVLVSLNQQVNVGDQIGLSDNTGNSTTEHCHVESALYSGGTITCPLYHGHFKYPVLFSPNAKVQLGHVLKVKATSTAIRSDRFDSSPVISTAHKDQLFFAAFAKRGYYKVFIPNDTTNRSGWISALDVEEIFSGGTVIQALPDTGAYVHTAQLAATYPIRSAANGSASIIGNIHWGGGRFVADQTAPGNWLRIPVPGASSTWGWVQANNRMVVYPEIYNPSVNLVNRPQQTFPFSKSYDTLGVSDYGRPKFDRCSVVNFGPAPDGKAFYLTDSINTGNASHDTVSFGRPEHRDYYVEARVYFNYAPSYAVSGRYERYGVFLRDDGFGGFDDAFEGAGNCYAMTWDCDDGYLRCGRIIDASITDLAPVKTYIQSSGWHTMRIEAQGANIRYYLDGMLKHSATDTTFASGLFGMAYSWHRYNGSNQASYPAGRGAYFDSFSADLLPGATVRDWALY